MITKFCPTCRSEFAREVNPQEDQEAWCGFCGCNVSAGCCKKTLDMNESDWQPIETAPRDGSQVVVWNPDNPYGEWPLMAQWHAPSQTWSIHIEGQRIWLGLPLDPTHWIPLPEPPEQ